ncbi:MULTISPECIES: GNAT family N-acetyltransferase [Luteimonas]|uniref:GNAT family N-acetyltransferase n=1 Tax=Luteimonas TaxID=83614 RepID=UPI000C79D32F|nr:MULTISPECIES: GNAT family N-acetyltransferase [Luteimonas]
MPDPEIRHDASHHLFELEDDGHRGHLEYRVGGGALDILHTIVEPAIGGRGLAGRLVEAARAHATAAGLQLTSSCTYASDYLDRHPDASP